MLASLSFLQCEWEVWPRATLYKVQSSGLTEPAVSATDWFFITPVRWNCTFSLAKAC